MALDHTGRGKDELDKTQTDLDDDKSQICNFDDGVDDEDNEAVFVTNRRSRIKNEKEKQVKRAQTQMAGEVDQRKSQERKLSTLQKQSTIQV